MGERPGFVAQERIDGRSESPQEGLDGVDDQQ